MQTCIKLLVGSLVIVLVTPAVFALTLIYTFLNPAYYKQILAESGLYNTINDTIQIGIDQVLAEQMSAFPPTWKPLLSRIGDITRSEISKATNSEFITPLVDKNIDNFFAYLNGYAEDIYIYIPKKQLRAITIDTITQIEAEVREFLATLPQCTPDQMAAFEAGTADCAPTEITPEMLNSIDITDTQQERFLGSFTMYFEGEEQTPLRELLQPGETETLEQMSAARAAIASLNLMTFAALGVLFALMVAYFFAAANTNRARAKSTAKLAFIVGLLVTAFGAGTYFLMRAFATAVYEQSLLEAGSRNTSAVEGELLLDSAELITRFTSDAFVRVIVVGIVISVVSLGIYILLRERKQIVKTVKVETTEQSTVASSIESVG